MIVAYSDIACKDKKERVFLPNLVLFMLLVFLRNAFDVPVPTEVLLIVYIMPIFYGSDDDLLALIVSCVPLYVSFQYRYALLILCVALLYRRRFKIAHVQVFFLVACIMIWELFHAYVDTFSFFEYLQGFSELITLAVVIGTIKNDFDYPFVFRTLALASVAICAIVLFLQVQKLDFSLLIFFEDAARFGGNNTEFENFGLNYNENSLGHICNMVIITQTILMLNRKYKLLDLVLLIFAVIFGIMTISRTFLICLAINVLIVFVALSKKKKGKHTISTVLALLIVVAAVVVTLKIVAPEFVEKFFGRFQESDISGGRIALLEFYHRHIWSSFKYFFFGIGLQNYRDKIEGIYGNGINVCHNGIQEIAVVWGVVGIILFVALLICVLSASKRISGRKQFILFVPFIIVIVFSMAGQIVSSGSTLMCLDLAVICLCICNEKTRGEKNYDS